MIKPDQLDAGQHKKPAPGFVIDRSGFDGKEPPQFKFRRILPVHAFGPPQNRGRILLSAEALYSSSFHDLTLRVKSP